MGGHHRIRVDKLASAFVNLRILDRPDIVQKQQTVECIWLEPGQQAVDRLKHDGIVGQLGVAFHALVSQRKSELSAVGRVKAKILEEAGTNIGKYPI